MSAIYTIIAYHLEVFFGDVLNKTLDEFNGWYGLSYKNLIFMAIVVESDSILVFIIGIYS